MFYQVFLLSVDDIDGCQNIRAISIKFLLFCCFNFNLKSQQNVNKNMIGIELSGSLTLNIGNDRAHLIF